METQTPAAPTAIILGSTGGVGSALARRLTAAGYKLALLGRDEAKVTALAQELNALPIVADATDAEAVERAFVSAQQSLGSLDGAANCVGSVLLKPAHLTSPEDWQRVMDTNLGSAFATVRAAAKTMTERGGSVVLVGSVAADLGLANHEAIAAAKAGVQGLTRAAAASYASKQLRFNAVAPALVQTQATAGITSNPRALEASRAMHPLGRIGQPDEVAAVIAFLLDKSNNWITGQVWGIDGGLSTVRSRASG